MGHEQVKLRQPTRLCLKVHKWDVGCRTVRCTGDWFVAQKSGQILMAPYVPDRGNTGNIISAVQHRFGCEMPKIDELGKEYYAYAKSFVLSLKPLDLGQVMSTAAWLDQSKYSLKVRRRLMSLLDSNLTNDDFYTCKSFIKDEAYEEIKAPRAINSLSDHYKVSFGPVIHAVDKALFSLPWFIKGSDPKLWPNRMFETFGQNRVLETDFSSMEAHHHGIYSNAVRFFFMHMVKHVLSNKMKRRLSSLLSDANICRFKGTTVKIHQRLMSGALWTSSANSFLNFTLLSFMYLKTKYPLLSSSHLVDHIYEFRGLIEGDDGICLDFLPGQMITQLGLRLKLEHHAHFGEAKFCGCICDPVERVLIRDPKMFIRDFFFLPSSLINASNLRKRSYLRAKALSLLYGFHSCPVIAPLCYQICRYTRSLSLPMSETGSWHFPCDIAFRSKCWMQMPEISDTTRLLLSDRYGISVDQQLALERQIWDWSGDGFLSLSIDNLISRKDVDFAHSHVTRSPWKYISDISLTGESRCNIPRRHYHEWREMIPTDWH